MTITMIIPPTMTQLGAVNRLKPFRQGTKSNNKTKAHRSKHHGKSAVGAVHVANIHDTNGSERYPQEIFHLFNGSVPIQDTAKSLRKVFSVNCASVLIFQY